MEVLRIEPRTLYTLSICSVNELHPGLQSEDFKMVLSVDILSVRYEISNFVFNFIRHKGPTNVYNLVQLGIYTVNKIGFISHFRLVRVSLQQK